METLSQVWQKLAREQIAPVLLPKHFQPFLEQSAELVLIEKDEECSKNIHRKY